MGTVQIEVKEIQFGQQYRDANGAIQIAGQDMVQQIVHIDGAPRFTIDISPEDGMDMAHAMMRAAGHLIQSRVGDDGKPEGILKTLSTIARSGRNN